MGELYRGEGKWIKNQECKKADQLDPESRNLIALKKVSEKLVEVSKALKQREALTSKLGQAIDIVAKSYAVLQVERIDEQLHSKDE